MQDQESIMTDAKRLAITREFADLRATDPNPPMVSNLGAFSDPGKALSTQMSLGLGKSSSVPKSGMRLFHPLDDDGPMDLSIPVSPRVTVPRSATSTSSSTKRAIQVVHPDSSGQPVHPPTPLKTSSQVILEEEETTEKEEMEEEEEDEEVAVVEEEVAVTEEVLLEEVEVTEEVLLDEEEEERAIPVAEQEQKKGWMPSAPPSSPSSPSTATTQGQQRTALALPSGRRASSSAPPTQGWQGVPLAIRSSSSAGAVTAASATLCQLRRTPSALTYGRSSFPLYISQDKNRNNNNPSSCCSCKCLELKKRMEALEAALKKTSKEAPAAAAMARTSMSSARTSSENWLQRTPESALKGEKVTKGGMRGRCMVTVPLFCLSVKFRSETRFWMIPPFRVFAYHLC